VVGADAMLKHANFTTNEIGDIGKDFRLWRKKDEMRRVRLLIERYAESEDTDLEELCTLR
jgi:hypothetical protein